MSTTSRRLCRFGITLYISTLRELSQTPEICPWKKTASKNTFDSWVKAAVSQANAKVNKLEPLNINLWREICWNGIGRLFFEPLGLNVLLQEGLAVSESIGEVRRDRVSHQRRDGDDEVTLAVVGDELAVAHFAVVDDVVVPVAISGIPDAFAELETERKWLKSLKRSKQVASRF